jgi:hypothetical protein
MLNIIVHIKGAVKPSDMGRCLKTITLRVDNWTKLTSVVLGL